MIPKFYRKNKINDGATFTFTSADETLASLIYDRKRTSRLSSVGSNDVTNEVWVIEFDQASDIDTILIDNHNLKSGNVKYWNGSAYTNFSTTASWSTNADTTTLFEFNSVNTTKIQITMSTTMTVDAEKTVGEVYVLETIGSPQVAPSQISREFIEDSRSHKKSGGGNLYVFFGKKIQLDYRFSDADATDVALFESLKDLKEEFFIYPCAGDAQTDIGFRLQDIYLVNYTNTFKPEFRSNLMGLSTAISLKLEEV